MIEHREPAGRKYEFLSGLSIETLEHLLHLESDSDETEELLDAVAEEIVQREREHPTGRIMRVDDAWHEFQTVYNTPEGKGKSLLSDEAPRTNRNAAPAGNRHTPAHSPLRRLGRSAATVVSVTFLVLILMIGAQAAGLDVFGTLARLTGSTFHHITVPRERDDSISLENTSHGSIDVQRVLGKYAPAWLPDDATPIESSIREDEFGVASQVSFSLPNAQKFFIRLEQYPEHEDIDSITFESDPLLEEKYISNSRLFYIIANDGYYMATWSGSTTMITISGDISVEDIRAIIDSIGG